MERLKSPDRITAPLLKAGERWRTVSWNDALDLCAEKIQRYRDEPSSILYLHSEGSKGVLKMAGNLFFGRLGTSHGSGSLCDATGIAACRADFGSLDCNDIRDILNARVIVNWGKDLSRSSIHVAALIKEARRGGADVITISPGGDGNGPFSDYHIRIRPGTDRFLAAAVIRLFMKRSVIDDAVLKRSRNGEAFLDLLAKRSIDELISFCQVSRDDVDRLFRSYTTDGPVATVFGWGLQRYRWGGENVRFINALAFLSGNIGRSGGGVYYNIPSLRNFSLGGILPSVTSKRRSLTLPTIGRSILEADNPPVRMIWVDGFNVINQAPDSQTISEAFQRTEFTVVVDAFMNDTARMADLILPCTLMFEQEDIVGSFLHNYIHYVTPVVAPPEQARDDYWIFSKMGRRLSPPIHMPGVGEYLEASLRSPSLKTTLEELKQKKYAEGQWPRIAYEEMVFHHPDGLYRFPQSLSEADVPPQEYPLRLLSLIRRDAIHSQIPPDHQTDIPTVWVAPENALVKTIDRHSDVYLVSPKGRLRVSVELLPGLHPEAVIYRRGDWMKLGGGVNQLIEAGLTDMGAGASYYSQCVRLEN